LPFSQAGGVLIFHLASKLYEQTSISITINLSLSKWATVFGDARLTTALLDRFTQHCHITRPAITAIHSRTQPPTRPGREKLAKIAGSES